MREIKFRYWDGKSTYTSETLAPMTELFVEPDVQAIMQYTGRKDRNDEEIYEGDIVPTPWGNAVITWSDAFAGFYAKRGGTHIALTEFQPEVIGNIYENPELLGVVG